MNVFISSCTEVIERCLPFPLFSISLCDLSAIALCLTLSLYRDTYFLLACLLMPRGVWGCAQNATPFCQSSFIAYLPTAPIHPFLWICSSVLMLSVSTASFRLFVHPQSSCQISFRLRNKRVMQ